jgi:uncharacterized membrane protein YphA (DoxX/SURF4 family)
MPVKTFLVKNSSVALRIHRIGLSAVILWFGVSQLLDPAAWVVWVPDWAVALSGLKPATIVLLNGGFEVVAGTLLLFSVLPHLVAFVLFLHLFVIVLDIGLTPTGVRDFGLAISLLVLAMYFYKPPGPHIHDWRSSS